MGRERNKNRELKPLAEVNLTPLIDITFLLLIALYINTIYVGSFDIVFM